MPVGSPVRRLEVRAAYEGLSLDLDAVLGGRRALTAL